MNCLKGTLSQDIVPTQIFMISNTNIKVSLKSEFKLELKSFSYLKIFCIMFLSKVLFVH